MDLILSTGALKPFKKPFSKIAQEALNAGFPRLEVMVNQDLMYHIEEVKSILRKGEIEIPAIHAPFGPLDPYVTNSDNAWIELMKKTIETAKDVEAKVITVHPGLTFFLPFTHKPWENMLNNLEEIIPLAHEAGVILGIENMPGSHSFHFWKKSRQMISEPKNMMQLFKELSSDSLKMTFDVSHAFRISKETIFEYIEHLGNHFSNIHISDCDGEVDHLPIGKGRIPFNNLFSDLGSHGYGGLLTLELSARHINAGDLKESRVRIEDFLRIV